MDVQIDRAPSALDRSDATSPWIGHPEPASGLALPASSQSAFFVGSDGTAALGTQLSMQTSEATSTFVSQESRLVWNLGDEAREQAVNSLSVAMSQSTEGAAVTTANTMEAAVVRNTEAVVTSAKTSSELLGTVGKVMSSAPGAAIIGGAVNAGVGLWSEAGNPQISSTERAVGAGVDFVLGAVSGIAGWGAGAATALVLAETGPGAVAGGFAVGTGVSVGSDYMMSQRHYDALGGKTFRNWVVSKLTGH